MKKTLLILGVAGMLFTSCDPLMDEGSFDSPTMTSEALLNGATFTQYNQITKDDGTVEYVPAADGNWIEFNIPSVSGVNIYYLKNGEKKKLLDYPQAGGMINFVPSRGSEPDQTIYFSYLNADGTEVVASKQFTLQVAQSLDPAVKVLVSNKGTKKWKWMPTNVNGGAVWGNGGYLAGKQDGSLDIAGAWWGCGVLDGECSDTFEGQGNHADGKYEEYKGECYAASYMEFNEDGSLTAYDKDGKAVNVGTFSIKNYNNNEVTDKDKMSRGSLVTSAGAILWPFQINANDAKHDGVAQPTSFEIGYLDVSRMVLIYAPKTGNAYDECTWWSFMSDDDAEGILASHDWYWRPTEVNGGAVWGNGGYAAGSQNGTGAINGAWWGCGVEDGDCPEKFSGQMSHAGPSYVAGEEYSTSKMVFNEDAATITLFDKDGKQIREGSFSVDMTPNPEVYSLGKFNTSKAAILWPFQINFNSDQHDGEAEPTSFEIGYLSSDALILIYPPKTGKAWDEYTWWSFGKGK